jgi:hypothetical protein
MVVSPKTGGLRRLKTVAKHPQIEDDIAPFAYSG